MRIFDTIKLKDIQGVFYWTAFFTYSHSLIVFFWDLKSLLLRFSLGEIFGYLSYNLIFSLAESCIVALVIIIITFIIPFKHVKDNIQVTGSLLVISLAIISVIFREAWDIANWVEVSFSINQNTAWQIVQFFGLYAIIGLPIISILLPKYTKINTAIITFTENLSVLGTFYFTLSIIGMLNVIYRNLA